MQYILCRADIKYFVRMSLKFSVVSSEYRTLSVYHGIDSIVYLSLFISGLRAPSYFGCWRLLGRFLCVKLGPQRTIWLQLSRIPWSFSVMPVCGLRGPAGPSCQELFGFLVCQFWASSDHLVPIAGNCFIMLYLSQSPQY